MGSYIHCFFFIVRRSKEGLLILAFTPWQSFVRLLLGFMNFPELLQWGSYWFGLVGYVYCIYNLININRMRKINIISLPSTDGGVSIHHFCVLNTIGPESLWNKITVEKRRAATRPPDAILTWKLGAVWGPILLIVTPWLSRTVHLEPLSSQHIWVWLSVHLAFKEKGSLQSDWFIAGYPKHTNDSLWD